jgi:small subunit ribosomal protein S7
MRKSKPKKRIILPDPKFNDPFVTRFVNNMMYSGKKNLALQIFYDSLTIIDEKLKVEGKSSLEIWKQALENINASG